jgi:hypothetical protein
MTELRSRFIAFLELKNYSPKTITSYVHAIKKFSEFLGYSPTRINQDTKRNYLLHLKRVKKLQLKNTFGRGDRRANCILFLKAYTFIAYLPIFQRNTHLLNFHTLVYIDIYWVEPRI